MAKIFDRPYSVVAELHFQTSVVVFNKNRVDESLVPDAFYEAAEFFFWHTTGGTAAY